MFTASDDMTLVSQQSQVEVSSYVKAPSELCGS